MTDRVIAIILERISDLMLIQSNQKFEFIHVLDSITATSKTTLFYQFILKFVEKPETVLRGMFWYIIEQDTTNFSSSYQMGSLLIFD